MFLTQNISQAHAHHVSFRRTTFQSPIPLIRDERVPCCLIRSHPFCTLSIVLSLLVLFLFCSPNSLPLQYFLIESSLLRYGFQFGDGGGTPDFIETYFPKYSQVFYQLFSNCF